MNVTTEIKQDGRSASFTQFQPNSGAVSGNRFIDFYNAGGRLKLSSEEKNRAHHYSCSGQVGAIIPVRNELGNGSAYPDTLEYFKDALGDPRKILVVDADSTDGSFEEAANKGIPVVKQGDIERALKGEKIEKDFDVRFPLNPGKGKTLQLGGLFYYYLRQRFNNGNYHVPEPVEIQESDSDIATIWKFDPATWFSWVSIQSKKPYTAVLAAQTNRNNQEVMHAITSRMGQNPGFDRDAVVFQEMKWPLSGQRRVTPSLLYELPGVTGYPVETMQDLASIAHARKAGGRIAQVEIINRCGDGQNSPYKEETMMGSISALVDAVVGDVYSKGYDLTNMPLEVYRLLNQELRRRECNDQGEPFSVSVISDKPGPNILIPARLDQVLSSPSCLVREGYVDENILFNIAQDLYGKVWSI